MLIECANCGKERDLPTGHVNRSRKQGRNVYCSLSCSCEGRRSDRSDAEKRAIKAAYDAEYRLRPYVKEKKRQYHQRTYDPEKARQIREQNRSYIEAYKRDYYARPENREHKRKYDRKRRCKLMYGEFWEAASVLIDLENQVQVLMPDHSERYVARGYYNKRQQRRRNAEAQRKEPQTGSMGNP